MIEYSINKQSDVELTDEELNTYVSGGTKPKRKKKKHKKYKKPVIVTSDSAMYPISSSLSSSSSTEEPILIDPYVLDMLYPKEQMYYRVRKKKKNTKIYRKLLRKIIDIYNNIQKLWVESSELCRVRLIRDFSSMIGEHMESLKKDSFNNYRHKVDVPDLYGYTKKELLNFIYTYRNIINIYVERIKSVYNLTLALPTGIKKDYFGELIGKSHVMSGGSKLDKTIDTLENILSKLKSITDPGIIPFRQQETDEQKQINESLKLGIEKSESNTYDMGISAEYKKDSYLKDESYQIDKKNVTFEYIDLQDVNLDVGSMAEQQKRKMNKYLTMEKSTHRYLNVNDFNKVTAHVSYDREAQKRYKEFYDNHTDNSPDKKYYVVADTVVKTCGNVKNVIIELFGKLINYKKKVKLLPKHESKTYYDKKNNTNAETLWNNKDDKSKKKFNELQFKDLYEIKFTIKDEVKRITNDTCKKILNDAKKSDVVDIERQLKFIVDNNEYYDMHFNEYLSNVTDTKETTTKETKEKDNIEKIFERVYKNIEQYEKPVVHGGINAEGIKSNNTQFNTYNANYITEKIHGLFTKVSSIENSYINDGSEYNIVDIENIEIIENKLRKNANKFVKYMWYSEIKDFRDKIDNIPSNELLTGIKKKTKLFLDRIILLFSDTPTTIIEVSVSHEHTFIPLLALQLLMYI